MDDKSVIGERVPCGQPVFESETVETPEAIGEDAASSPCYRERAILTRGLVQDGERK